MNDMFIRIVTEAQESEEEFIFTTIQPFCEDVTKRKISKAELVKLLSQPQIVRCGECKFYVEHTLFGRTQGWCERLCDEFDRSMARGTEIDDYCSKGERRADDE